MEKKIKNSSETNSQVNSVSYEELKLYLKQLQKNNKISLLNSFYCRKTNLRTVKFYLNGFMHQFECGPDESEVTNYYNKVKQEIN